MLSLLLRHQICIFQSHHAHGDDDEYETGTERADYKVGDAKIATTAARLLHGHHCQRFGKSRATLAKRDGKVERRRLMHELVQRCVIEAEMDVEGDVDEFGRSLRGRIQLTVRTN